MSNQLTANSLNEAQRKVAPMLRVALLLGVLVHLLGFFFFRVTSNPLPSRSTNSAFLSLIPADRGGRELELIEQASLFDSAPLFIPGKWSSSSYVFSLQVDDDLQVFPEFEPAIELLDELKPVRLSLLEVEELSQPSDLLELRFWDLFDSFGEGEVGGAPFDGNGATAVVTILSGGDELPASNDLRYGIELETDVIGLRPAIYYLTMSGPGLPVGAPVIRQSSGSDVLDAEVLAWIIRPATLAKLPAGLLELRIFP